MGTRIQDKVGMALLLAGLGLAEPALASVGTTGGSRILGTDFLIELFTVATSVWIPVILGLTGVGVLVGLASGRLRMSEGVSKWVVIILLGGAGVTGIASMLGLNSAIALTF